MAVTDTRINGTSRSKPFTSNVGTPQGDSLSPVLFTVYLEHTLKKVRPTLSRPTAPFEAEIPYEVAYSDDIILLGKTTQTLTRFKKREKNTSVKSTRRKQSTLQYKKAIRLVSTSSSTTRLYRGRAPRQSV